MSEIDLLREELSRLDKEFIELFVKLREKFIRKARNSFTTFFSSQGFSVAENPETLKATRGNIEITLHIPSVRVLSFGSIIVFPISIRIFKNQYDYNLSVVTPDISAVSYSAWYSQSDKEKKKKEELELYRIVVSNLKENIERLKNGDLRFAFFLYKKGSDKRKELNQKNFTLSLEEAFQRILNLCQTVE